MFQILDEMNVADGENGTAHLGVCDSFVETRMAKGGGHVTMGVPASVVHDLVFKKDKAVILLIIDKAEYEKLSNS